MACNTKYSISHVSTKVLWDKALETKSFWLIVYYYLYFRQVKLELKSLYYVRISRSTIPVRIFHFWFYLIFSLFLKFHCVKSSKYGIFSGSCSARVPGNTNQKKLCTPHEIRTRKNSRRVWLTGLIRMSEKCSLRNLFSIGFQGQSHRFFLVNLGSFYWNGAT